MTTSGEGIGGRLQDALKRQDQQQVRAHLKQAVSRPGPHQPATCSVPPDPRTHVVLTTNDGATFHPDRGFITEHSGLIRDLLAGADDEVIKEAVPLPNVAARELTHMLWLLGQSFTIAQLERCIAAFNIEGVVALQEAANFMDVRCITAACGGVIAQFVLEAINDEERTQLLELVTPPRLPQELCELWLGRFGTKADDLLKLLAQHPDQLIMPLAHWDAAWADNGRFSDYSLKLSDKNEFTLFKTRSEVIEQSQGASSLKVRLHSTTNDDDLRRVKELSVLTSLNLTGCKQITDAGLAHVKELTQLTLLYLSFCNLITDAGLVHLKELTQLTSLNLSGDNLITDGGLRCVKELTQLTSLNLSFCSLITDAGLAHVKELNQLAELSLWDCNLITDAGLVHVKELLQLTSLHLSGDNLITDAGLAHVKELTQLTSLNLYQCNQITDAGLAHVKELKQLTRLCLLGCKEITDTGLAHVKELKQLTKLDLNGGDLITDTGLAHVKELTQLTLLNLSYCNKITDDGLAHVKELTQLTELNLCRCDQITSQGELFARLFTADVDAHVFTHADPMRRLPDGTTLLHVAAQKNRTKAVAVLLGKGADVNAVDSQGRTPLRVALEANATDAIRLLQQRDVYY